MIFALFFPLHLFPPAFPSPFFSPFFFSFPFPLSSSPFPSTKEKKSILKINDQFEQKRIELKMLTDSKDDLIREMKVESDKLQVKNESVNK